MEAVAADALRAQLNGKPVRLTGGMVAMFTAHQASTAALLG